MQELLFVGVGGFVGAVSRFYLSGWVQRLLFERYGPEFPFFALGTMAVNVAGCFLIGLATVLVQRNHLSTETQLVLMTGFLGALTTFSTFGSETVEMFLKEGDARFALLNVVGNLALGIGAVVLGRWSAQLVLG
ncbi:fluoride efflux transporter CrcB [Symmachiella dynata]|uniref:fluoride efflux transporter CrcB n=1 Tax=Symmachiella dynata TaxID=2527995 RepID=UPI0011883F2C|nr:fluoride efflux transporter CrcB [Symmachiella dynata]QDT49511.1 Putative fluoride ion transporter CrcB [Symmachiella dynata]